MIDRGGGTSKVSLQSIANTALKQYNKSTSSGGNSNIVKSIQQLLNPTKTTKKPQQTNKSAGFSYGRKLYQKVVAFDKKYTSGRLDPVTHKDKSNTSPLDKQGGGQFGGITSSINAWREDARPKTISEFAQVAAKADTATDKDVYNYYNKLRTAHGFHDAAISTGQSWMSDQKRVNDWILSAASDEEANARIDQINKYMDGALHEVPTYDPNTHQYSSQLQFKADADLPPWVPRTKDNLDMWEYYTTYAHDVVAASVQAYNDARDEGREQARNPYKSAFADSEKSGQIDSFLDVIIAGVDPNSASMTYENIARGTAKYLNEYVWNPIKTGHLKTAAGNALWNLMDTMDVASRGVRGLVAGETALGGSGGKEFKSANSKFDDYYAKTWEKYGVAPSKEYEQNKNHGTWKYRNDATFKGQDVYWAKLEGHSDEEVQKAQQLFMDQGGFNLLLAKFPSTASKTQFASGEIPSTQEEKEAIEKHLDMMFQGSDINWRDIYDDIVQNYYDAPATEDLKKGFENVKKAYTDVDANFQADTGSMASDIIIESVLDPGLVVGGLSKGVAKGTVRSAAQNGVEEGFRAILRNSDDVGTLFNNKNVQRAFKSFINSNEGKNIIFKDAKKFDEDIELFMKRVGKESPIFSTQAAKDNFKRTVTAHLMGKQTSVNGAVIEAQNFARNALDKKIFKAAYYMDKAIDGVDSAIVKSSFFLPWAGIKGAKALGHGVLNSKTLGKISARLTLRKANTMRTIVDEATGKVDVTKIDNLMNEFENGMHYEKDVRSALMQVVDQYDSVVWNINDVIRKFSRGEITDEDALRLVGEYIHDITGGKYRYVQELSGYVDNIAIRYAGDVKSAFGRIDDTFRRLQNLIDRRSANAVDGFLDEVRQAENIDELRVLFREHMDNSYIMALRNQVIDNAQFELTLDDIESLVNEVRTGLFSDESVTKDIIRKGVRGQMKMSEKTIRRAVSFGQFDEILESIGVDWRTVLRYDGMDLGADIKEFSSFETKLSNFMAAWMDQPDVTYTIDDALKFVDRLERQIHFKELMQTNIPSEVSALSAHKLTGECNKLRKMLKRLDIINLKDVKYVTLPQMDRMAMNLNFRNNQDIQNMYGSFYDDVIDPIWRQFKGKTSDEIDLMDSSLFDDIDQLAKQKYGFDRTSQLIEEAKTLPGFSDDHLHSFLNTLATDFRFRDELGNIDLSPGMLRRKVEATLRAQTGQSKVGMKNITDTLTSIDSENPSQFLAPYVDIFKESPELKSRYMRYVETDVLDPRAYVEKQMLFTALADPSVIPEWNALAAKGQTPVLMHINTTGLNSEINSITSVSFRKWVPIDIPYNEAGNVDNEEFLKRLLDAFDGEETTVIQRRMADSEFDEFTEQVIRQLDIKDSVPENIKNRFKGYYGVTDSIPYKSENEMMEEACAYIQGLTRQVDDNGALRSVAPTLVVHDLDGFNVNYFNNKIMSMYDPKNTSSAAYDYVTRISKSAKENSCNTYTRLAEKSGDLYYTDEQLDMITDLLHDYIDDINYYANGYRINDMQSYSRKLHEMIDTLNLKRDAGQLTEAEEEFLDMFDNAGGSSMLASYDKAIKDITSLGYYPRQYAFLSSGLEDNFTKAALEATGRTSVNVNNRIVVDNVLSYFDIATEDGFYTTVEDLRKMNEMAKYIINTRDRQIVAGAEEFLTPHKAELDIVIQSVIDLANSNSYEATKLAYLQNMRIPDNAIDSYLMARKLYNDHLKYWLDTDELTSLRTGGKDLDAMKLRLYENGSAYGFDDPRVMLDKDSVFKQACDYVNNNRVKFFDELTGGGFNTDEFSLVDEMLEKASDERNAFWTKQIEDGEAIWSNMKEVNKSYWNVYNIKKVEVNRLYEKVLAKYRKFNKETYKEVYNLERTLNQYYIPHADAGEEWAKREVKIAEKRLSEIAEQKKIIWKPYDEAKKQLADELAEIRRVTQKHYDNAEMQSALHYADGYYNYLDLRERQALELYDNIDALNVEWQDKTKGILDLLQGAHEPEIFNWAARSDFEKQVLNYKNGVMKSGLDKAAKYSEAGSQIKSEMRQLQHMDDYFTAAGIARSQDRFTASVYMKSNQLFEILEQGGFLKRESFHEFLQKVSDVQRLHLQDYRLRSLRNSEGVFDSDKLLSELVYNGFNMSVFNSHNYSPKEIKELRKFVEDLQTKYNFISYYEDRTTGNVFIYLNNNAEIAEADGMRWINKTMKFERPVHDVIPFAEFDELVDMLDIDDIEDFRGVYAHLKSCWEDTRLLSLGQINGTTGRTVSRRQAEGFLQSLPSNMNDWLTSEGLLRDEMARGIIYDPGFVINDQSDMLTDFLGTLQRQAETAKDDAIIVNEVFHSNGSVHFNELASNFSDEELIEYFGENPEYIVCTIVGNEKTATGLQIKQLNLSNRMGLEAAKNTPNTTILPYNTYCELSNYMNREVADDNVYKQLLGKYMLVYKAFALVRPGTWMRNFIDATTKAAFDNGNGVDNMFSMLQYEGKAARDIGTYGQILKSDASLLTPANWDIIQRTFKTDMTYEDFELLRGVMDSDRFKSADKYFLSRTTRQRGGFNIISGENIGLRNLEYDDISNAYEKYLSKEFDLPLSKKEFLDIYTGNVAPDAVVNEQFEDMFRKLSNNMRNSNASTIFDKTIDTMFKPFGTVEELVRYAQTLNLRDSGFSQNQITRHIHNTQFYSAPSSGAWRKLENIMPFITFKFNNMMYWVRMMDENPRLFRLFEDMYRSVYDTTLESALEEGVELDYESDYGLQSGGIPIGNGKRYFNMGSSFLSAINDFYGLPHDIDSLNPLIRDSVRGSMYAFGLNSKQFFSTINLELTDEQVMKTVESAVPGLTLAKKAAKTFKTISGICSESGGPTMEVLCTTLDFLGITGSRYQYNSRRDGRFSFDEWQDELAAQGKWYDANLGKIVDISQKNEFGANDPNNSFKDVQTYMLVHFGKVWDANQRKFVSMGDYQAGGYNSGFSSFEDVCEYMKLQGKVWDANQRKFVYPSERIGGGLNNRDQEWETVVALMEEHFPTLKWDANQQTFVEKQYYISGGLNDVHNFREVMSLRKALYGETYNRNLHKFEVTEEPSIVTMDSFMEIGKRKDYDNYFALLAIPRMWSSDKKYYVDNEGLFRTSDGKYIVTGNVEHDAKVFEKFKHEYDYTGRSYNGYKNYSYNKTKASSKPYKGRYTGSTAYQTGYGWNEEYGYYREAFEYSYQYHSPQPGNKLNRLIFPPTHYPYGGGYNKFSFHNRY